MWFGINLNFFKFHLNEKHSNLISVHYSQMGLVELWHTGFNAGPVVLTLYDSLWPIESTLIAPILIV